MYAFCIGISTLFGAMLAWLLRGYLDRRANGAAGSLYSGTEPGDAEAAGRLEKLEDTVARAESANEQAIKTIKGLQDLLDTVRGSSSNTGSSKDN